MNPLERAASWLDEARAAGAPEPEAMALATANASGIPSVRIVLCRGIDARGLRFFTNYESRKGMELAENPRAAVTFHWPALGRQLRAEGRVERLSAAESDAYFVSRPRGHRIAAHASAQSRPLGSLEELRLRAEAIEHEMHGRDVPRPAYWGGYRLVANAIELWTLGANRLHDRVRMDLQDGIWHEQRLAP